MQQMQQPAVLDARPYVQLRAIIDPRTTSVCRFLNGLVFDRQNDPGWQRFAPPNHYNCRTTTILFGRNRVSPSQIIHSSDVDRRGWPLPPFDSAPALTLDVAAEE